MPLPVSHSLAGIAIYSAADADGGLRAWPRLAAAVVIANAPDLDLLPGLLIGDPNRFHQGITHTLGGAVLVAVATAVVLGATGWRWPLRGGARSWLGTTLLVTALWSSHLLLDLLTEDGSAPVGIPLLWPLSDEYFNLWPLFARGDKVVGPASPLEFVRSLLSVHNLVAVLREIALLGPLVLLAQWSRRSTVFRRRP